MLLSFWPLVFLCGPVLRVVAEALSLVFVSCDYCVASLLLLVHFRFRTYFRPGGLFDVRHCLYLKDVVF